ncbi:hypothetical protein HPB47_008314 [Ixodes persulcatus]|uniref:Uncharacterized protein n=1 Tax=Ixodes persulcatus TaxID=34615 RepID=A0AC60P5H7_IXOPE|nr:hypothetical protein HPB47_008314 [Ixodes persulcatus]
MPGSAVTSRGEQAKQSSWRGGAAEQRRGQSRQRWHSFAQDDLSTGAQKAKNQYLHTYAEVLENPFVSAGRGQRRNRTLIRDQAMLSEATTDAVRHPRLGASALFRVHRE